MKRILIFSLVYYPRFVGGAEVALKEITDRISPEDIEFHMVTLRIDRNLPRRERIGNIIVHRIGFVFSGERKENTIPFPLSFNKYLFPFLGAWKAWRLNQELHFSAFWSSQANYAGFAALFFSFFKPRISFLLTLQEGDPIEHYKKRVGILLPLYRKIFSRADAVQAISSFLADFARDMGHTGVIQVIPNGVTSAHFERKPSEEEKERIGRLIERKEGDIFLITTSRLVKKNDVVSIIRALTLLPENILLLIAGTGPLENMLRQETERLGLNKRVRFLGQVDHKDMPVFLHSADIFIRPSLSEGMGNSFIEAMAAGLPIIATPVGGIVDFLFDPERNPEKPATGLFVPVESPEAIAKQVKRLLQEPALREQIVLNARHLVTDFYDWITVTKRIEKDFLE